MKETLEERVGVEVSDSTVWRALTWTGFTLKKV
jgi:transposase